MRPNDTDEVFEGTPFEFSSPFPSNDAQLSGKFQAFAVDNPGKMAALQAKAWRIATQMSLREIASSTITGGIRTDWWNKLVWDSGEKDTTGQPIRDGLFAQIDFSSSAEGGNAIGKDLMVDMRRRGFNKALGVISSNGGVYGKIVVAFVKVGQFFMSFALRDKKVKLLTVPWQEYSETTEDSLVNAFLLPMIESEDWTALFAPGLDPSRGFRTGESKRGPGTRVFGAFRVDTEGIAGEPAYVAGFGFLPGTQRMAEVMQVAGLAGVGASRVDEVTNVGDFYPSTSQFATAAEQLVMKAGSADMYKVQPVVLESLWRDYWGAFFEDGFGEISRFRRAGGSQQNEVSALFTAKALAPWIHWRDKRGRTGLGFAHDFITTAGNLDAFINEHTFKPGGGPNPKTTYSSPFESIIKPSLDRIRTAQKNALARTLACAYVRYEDVRGLPPFAAFDDSAHGREIAKLCEDARELLLKSDLRYRIRTKDVEAVDPVFGAKLRASKGIAPPFGIKGTDQPLISAIPAVPMGELPEGGTPFDIMPAVGGRKGGAGVALAAAVGIVALAAGRR